MREQENNYEFPLVEGMEVNDCHIHIHHWEDGVKNSKQNFMEQLEEYRKLFGISHANIVCIPCYENLGVNQNIMGALLKLEHPEYSVHAGLDYHCYPVVLPFPEGVRPEQQLEDVLAVGFDGIKMLEEKPSVRKKLGISLADPAFEAFFAKLEENQIHVLWHVNDPEEFWIPGICDKNHPDWNYCSEGHLSYEETLEEVLTVLRRHPKLKITFAHLFFMERYPDRLVELLETYPNVGIDITPHTDMYMVMSKDRIRWREIFTKYADRIMFGTDYDSSYGKTSDIGHKNVYQFLLTNDRFLFWHGKEAHGLGLDTDTVQKILGRTYLRRIGPNPKPIDRNALRAYIQKYQPMIKDTAQKEQILAYCAEHGLL